MCQGGDIMAEDALALVIQNYHVPVLIAAVPPALFSEAVARRVHIFVWNMFGGPLDCHWPLPESNKEFVPWKLAHEMALSISYLRKQRRVNVCRRSEQHFNN